LIASLAHGAAEGRDGDLRGDPRCLDERACEGTHEAGPRNRADCSLASHARRGDCIPIPGDRRQGNDAPVQEVDRFDFIAGQVQELALADGDDLQMRLEKRKIPRPQRGQQTIASMLVLIWRHVGPTSPSARHSMHLSLAATNDSGSTRFLGRRFHAGKLG
jgi:hypothetical protein